MFDNERKPHELWAYITAEGEVIDTRIINTIKYPTHLPKEYRMVGESDDLELLESLEKHIRAGRLTYHGWGAKS